MREKMTLRQFEKFALPMLQAKHAGNADKINAAIKNQFDITDGNRPVEFTIGFPDGDGVDGKSFEESISQAVEEKLDAIRKSHPMNRNPLGHSGNTKSLIPATVKQRGSL